MLKYLIFAITIISGCVDANSEGIVKNNPIGNSMRNAKSGISIDLSSADEGKKISKWFYSTQLSPFTDLPDGKNVRELGIGTVRIGGNLYDRYDWQSGLVYLSRRYYVKLDPYEDLIEAVRTYGAEPIFQINLMGWRPVRVGSSINMRNTADSKSAADFIEHVNGRLGLRLQHVCLGNEFAQWAETHYDVWPDKEPLTADKYIDRFIKFSIAIREAQERVSGNPDDIKIWGPEISISYLDWQSGNMAKDCRWSNSPGRVECSYGNGKYEHFLPYFYSRLRDAEKDRGINPRQYKLLDYASFHYYPNFRTNIADPDSIITDADGYQMVNEMLESTQILHNEDYVNTYDRGSYLDFRPALLKRMKKWLIENYPDAKLVISEFAVDSFDTTHNYHPIVRPLYMADFIGQAAINGIASFNRSFLNSNNPDPIPWTLILDDKPTHLYNVYKLFTQHFRGSLLDVSDSFGDRLNAYATLAKNDGEEETVNVLVVNKSADFESAEIVLSKGNGLSRKFSYDFSPWSVTALIIPKRGNGNEGVKILKHGAEEMGIKIDPHYKR